MVVILQNNLDSKEELDKEIQSQPMFLFSPYKFFLFLSSETKTLIK